MIFPTSQIFKNLKERTIHFSKKQQQQRTECCKTGFFKERKIGTPWAGDPQTCLSVLTFTITELNTYESFEET